MKIELECQECNTRLKVPAEHLGKMARCPRCRHLNLISDVPVSLEPPRSTLNSQPDASGFAGESNPYAGSVASSLPAVSAASLKPHRGMLILIMGIVSVFANVMFVPGIFAWVAGRNDLQEMTAGLMDREGESHTRIGMIIGIVMTIFGILSVILLFGFLLLVFVFAAAQN